VDWGALAFQRSGKGRVVAEVRELYVFGRTRLRSGNGTLTAAPAGGRLLGYLAAGGTEPRAEVAAALWPNASDARAGTALRTSLTRLRKEIGDGWVAASRDSLQIDEDVWCDCRSLEQAVCPPAGAPAPSLSQLHQALTLYTADAFRGCYDDWALEQRDRLRHLALLSYERLVERAGSEQNWDLTLEAALAGLALEPHTESFHRGVILAHGYRGNPAAAIRQYNRLESMLAAEFQLRPSAATREAMSRALAAAQGSGPVRVPDQVRL
jgi:DNA-binding SARP family transcriptional activator